MNIDELEKRLLEKEQELWADMSRTEAEGRALGGPEAQNGADSAEIKETIFQETSADWRLYTQIRAALERLKEGTYGRCLDCGHPIEDERLESVPWTPYCLRHQELHDRQPLA